MWLRDMGAWCFRTPLDDSIRRMEDVLEEVLQHREPEALRQCLRKVRARGCGGPSPQWASVFPGVKWEQSWEFGLGLGAPDPGPEHPFIAYSPARL